MVILPLESKAYTANKELQYISVVNLILNKCIDQINAPSGRENIGGSPDGQFVFMNTLSTSKEMSIVDAQSDAILCNTSLDYCPSEFEVAPSNPFLIYVRHMNVEYENGFHSIDDGYLQEIKTKLTARRVKNGKNPLNIIITKDGKQAYLSCEMSHWIDVIDLNNMKIIGKIDTSPSPHCLAFAD